ncbi:hypothetical protein VNO78_05905 [Psophocarpus tetragonolobus]|uniref:Uncharacterized protein n=1 Tax=Psophocarpus tetragonolobus TaxID=3891 RepID=A0AAN9SRP4_PSOTE
MVLRAFGHLQIASFHPSLHSHHQPQTKPFLHTLSTNTHTYSNPHPLHFFHLPLQLALPVVSPLRPLLDAVAFLQLSE